ncbi:MAG TPA: hypothetical protein VJL34_00455 [Anaerolineales bacterium]|nr:hypothetical protein [Anaerolineales bacterium]
MHYTLTFIKLSFIFTLLLVFTACSAAAQEAPTATPAPATSTLLLPSDTAMPPTATETLTETSTATQPPTATETLPPSLTLTLTPTETATPTSTAQPLSASQAIVKYLVILGTGGNVGCGDSLLPVSTGHRPSGDVVKDVTLALNSLFSTGVKYVGDLYNPLYQSGLRVDRVDFKKYSGVTVIYLSGSFTKPKDNCDRLLYRAQVWQTIRQFKEIKDITVVANKYLLGDLLVPTR